MMDNDTEEIKSLLLKADRIFASMWTEAASRDDTDHHLGDLEIARKHLRNCYKRLEWIAAAREKHKKANP